MHRKSVRLFYLLIGLLLLLVLETVYLLMTQSSDAQKDRQKAQFVTLVGLPDLALVTETSSIRHRSLTDIFSLYREDASLREYFPTTFTYTVSPQQESR